VGPSVDPIDRELPRIRHFLPQQGQATASVRRAGAVPVHLSRRAGFTVRWGAAPDRQLGRRPVDRHCGRKCREL